MPVLHVVKNQIDLIDSCVGFFTSKKAAVRCVVLLKFKGAVNVLNHLNRSQNLKFYLKQPSKSVRETGFKHYRVFLLGP